MKRRAIVVLLASGVVAACSDNPTQPTTAIAPKPYEEPGATISGTVTDTLNQPLADENVQWADVAGALGDRGHGMQTDISGTYHLYVFSLGGPGATENRFDLYVHKDGYVDQMVEMTLSQTTVNFRLAPVAATKPGS